MKILPITNVSVNNTKQNDNAQKMSTLPKSVNITKNFSNPTFKNCGAEQAAVLAGCSAFGIT